VGAIQLFIIPPLPPQVFTTNLLYQIVWFVGI